MRGRYKKQGPDPHLSRPSGLSLTQAVSVVLENHASTNILHI